MIEKKKESTVENPLNKKNAYREVYALANNAIDRYRNLLDKHENLLDDYKDLAGKYAKLVDKYFNLKDILEKEGYEKHMIYLSEEEYELARFVKAAYGLTDNDIMLKGLETVNRLKLEGFSDDEIRNLSPKEINEFIGN